jgi:hypothetical protein
MRAVNCKGNARRNRIGPPWLLLHSEHLHVGKRVWRVYPETIVDTYSKTAIAKLYDRKTPLPAVDLLNDRVLPFLHSYGSPLARVLTGGTEYCGNPEHHDYGLYPVVENIDLFRTQAGSAQTSSTVEWSNTTMLSAFIVLPSTGRFAT